MAVPRALAQRAIQQESDVLIRKIDNYLANLGAGRPGADREYAERMASALRQLIADTARASAVDRARVRAAVHYFVSRGAATGVLAARARSGAGRLALITGGRSERRPSRTASDDDRVVNDLFRELGRPDLVVVPPA